MNHHDAAASLQDLKGRLEAKARERRDLAKLYKSVADPIRLNGNADAYEDAASMVSFLLTALEQKNAR